MVLEEYFGDRIPPYAILSHTWEEEEVSFQDWADQSSAAQKKGYKKIRDACKLAQKHEHDYLWVDTNCIDKSSSAELSEAINSMFKWYQLSQVCYVYLADVPSPEAQPLDLDLGVSEGFRYSRWFTRGWTLQELLAPIQVEFYSADWSFLGTKGTLCSAISSITRIEMAYLWSKQIGDEYIGNKSNGFLARSIEHAVPLHKASVSKRLSWVSDRTTTRLEDIAYCMLGIFGLNMPLLYGEGIKAFIRLQEEIMKVSDDHSLFCWGWGTPMNQGSFLSDHPSLFSDAGQFTPKEEDKRPAPYTFTNVGLSIQLPILHGWQSSFIDILGVTAGTDGKCFGVPMYGDLRTGRVSRQSFPPDPIPLCEKFSEARQYDMFVSEKYIPKQDSMPSIPNPSLTYWWLEKGHSVLLSFETPNMIHDIITYPGKRFDPLQSSISIYTSRPRDKYVQNEERLLSLSGFWSTDREMGVYEGVLVQLELQPVFAEVLQYFMVVGRFSWEAQADMKSRFDIPCKRYCYPVSPEDAESIIFSGKNEINARWKTWFHKTMQDPSCDEVLCATTSKVSISLAKDYLQVARGGLSISHMHISQPHP